MLHEITLVIVAVCSALVGLTLGREMTRARMFSTKPTRAAKREDETVLMHEGLIDEGAFRLTLRTRSRVASFLVPREIVYQMSDDLMRGAAQLGKREQPQRGPE